MSDPAQFLVFLAAAGALAVMPGPGLLYLTARALAEGRAVALRCCVGSFGGGLVHVVAGSAGLSALLLASSTAFSVLKMAGGFYLLWLAWKHGTALALRTACLALGVAADRRSRGSLSKPPIRKRLCFSSPSSRSSSM